MRQRTTSIIVLTLMLIAALAGTASSESRFRVDTSLQLHDGVTWEQVRATGPDLYVNVAHVSAGAPVAFVPVLSNEEVLESGRRPTERVTSMCAHAGGIVCTNADFWQNPTTGEPVGGMVIDGVPIRSPLNAHEHVTMLTDGTLLTDKLVLDMRLVGVWEGDPDTPGQEAPHEFVIGIDEINRPAHDTVVLYSPFWGPSTRTPSGVVEATFVGSVPRIGSTSSVTIGDIGGPSSNMPPGGFVLAASGGRAAELAAQVDHLRSADRIELRIDANMPALMSVGGHPVILDRGERVEQNLDDGKVRNRHPRTLMAWNEAGDVWLVAVDGRRDNHSVGMTIAEAADYLLSIGATTAINFDGGGSTTFATAHTCGDGTSPCIRNLPSDGRERYVSNALAIVPAARPASVAEEPSSAPTTTTAPPPTVDTTQPLGTGEPDMPPPTTATTVAPATTAAPTTVASTTTTSTTVAPTTTATSPEPMAPPPSVEAAVAPETIAPATEVALPVPRRTPPGDFTGFEKTVVGGLALLLVVGWGGAIVATRRRH